MSGIDMENAHKPAQQQHPVLLPEFMHMYIHALHYRRFNGNFERKQKSTKGD